MNQEGSSGNEKKKTGNEWKFFCPFRKNNIYTNDNEVQVAKGDVGNLYKEVERFCDCLGKKCRLYSLCSIDGKRLLSLLEKLVYAFKAKETK